MKEKTEIEKILDKAGFLAGAGIAMLGLSLMTAMLHFPTHDATGRSNIYMDLASFAWLALGALNISLSVNRVAKALIYISGQRSAT